VILASERRTVSEKKAQSLQTLNSFTVRRSPFTFVGAAAGARLVNDNAAEQRQLRFHLIPNPTREILARGILEARDLIQIMMIESIERRLKRCAHVCKVHDPTRMRVDVAREVQLHAKRVPMHARALVPGRHIWQTVRCLDREGAKEMQKRNRYAALRRRELEAQLHVPHVQRIALQSLQTLKSTEP
jgi:hypothetical protein